MVKVPGVWEGGGFTPGHYLSLDRAFVFVSSFSILRRISVLRIIVVSYSKNIP